jgi:hypothetical protein
MVGLMVVGLLMASATAGLFAGNGPGNGRGYGGPPRSAEERAARQAACIEKNGGVCPNGGPGASCPGLGQGKGQGQGQGKGQRWGACDGTGPRAGTGSCPVIGSAQTQK